MPLAHRSRRVATRRVRTVNKSTRVVFRLLSRLKMEQTNDMKGKIHCPPPLEVCVWFTGACARTLLRLVPVNRIHSRASSWMYPSVFFGRAKVVSNTDAVAPFAPPFVCAAGPVGATKQEI